MERGRSERRSESVPQEPSQPPRYRVLELCKNRAGYEAVPEDRVQWDLDAVERHLTAAGFDALTNAGIILVVRWGAVEMSVFESGKLLFKTKDEDVAAATHAAFAEAMGWR